MTQSDRAQIGPATRDGRRRRGAGHRVGCRVGGRASRRCGARSGGCRLVPCATAVVDGSRAVARRCRARGCTVGARARTRERCHELVGREGRGSGRRDGRGPRCRCRRTRRRCRHLRRRGGRRGWGSGRRRGSSTIGRLRCDQRCRRRPASGRSSRRIHRSCDVDRIDRGAHRRRGRLARCEHAVGGCCRSARQGARLTGGRSHTDHRRRARTGRRRL